MTAPVHSHREQKGPVPFGSGEDGGVLSVREVARDLVVRAIPPALVLLVVGLAVGHFVVPLVSAWTREDQLDVMLQAGRTPFLDGLARLASTIRVAVPEGERSANPPASRRRPGRDPGRRFAGDH